MEKPYVFEMKQYKSHFCEGAQKGTDFNLDL